MAMPGGRWAALALLLAVGGAPGAWAQEAGCPLPGQSPMLEVELFFGLGLPDHHMVPPAAWDRFVAGVLAPAFPDGFTVLEARGQWRNPKTGAIGREPSRMVVIATPDTPAMRAAIAAVSRAWRARFAQEAVGVVTRKVCGAF